jgi:hypothetical protein
MVDRRMNDTNSGQMNTILQIELIYGRGHMVFCRRPETMPGDYGCFDDRIRNWDEEWVSQLLEEALRLKKQFGESKRRPSARSKLAKV